MKKIFLILIIFFIGSISYCTDLGMFPKYPDIKFNGDKYRLKFTRANFNHMYVNQFLLLGERESNYHKMICFFNFPNLKDASNASVALAEDLKKRNKNAVITTYEDKAIVTSYDVIGTKPAYEFVVMKYYNSKGGGLILMQYNERFYSTEYGKFDVAQRALLNLVSNSGEDLVNKIYEYPYHEVIKSNDGSFTGSGLPTWVNHPK